MVHVRGNNKNVDVIELEGTRAEDCTIDSV